MPNTLTSHRNEYLKFIRQYIKHNKSAPRLDEIARQFRVKSPKAHKMLKALQSEGYLYFNRDRLTGFNIRVPEWIGTNERLYEVSIIGKVNRYGELLDFPQRVGHFPMTGLSGNPKDYFAIDVRQHISTASIKAGDYMICNQQSKSVPGEIGIIPFGGGWLLARLYSLIIDEDLPFYVLIQDTLAEWNTWARNHETYLCW